MNYSLLADIIVVIHLAYACFVLFGFIAIVIGAWLRWSWIKKLPFRIIHLICTVFVPLETILSMTCPLTTLENYFLKASGTSGYERSFIGNLAGKILFYDAPEWVFAVIYFALAIMVIFYFFRFPPKRK
jgi:hypothetical protein